MNKEQLMRRLVELRKPSVLLSLLVVIGLTVNITIYTVFLAPKYKLNHSISARQSDLQNQVQQLQKKPIPAKVSEKDIEFLVKQVPVSEELPRLLASFRDMERKSGSTIASLTLGEDKSKEDPFAAAVANAAKAQQAAQQPNAAGGSSGSSGTQQGNTSGSGIVESTINLIVTGNYTQVMDFVNGLYQLERLVSIQKWSLKVIPQSPAAGASGTKQQQQAPSAQPSTSPTQADTIELQLTLKSYTAQKYAGKFMDLPQLEVQAPEVRLDPTMTDEQFLKLLQSLGQPAVN
jgi:Tfp pilus assembly protein PilO